MKKVLGFLALVAFIAVIILTQARDYTLQKGIASAKNQDFESAYTYWRIAAFFDDDVAERALGDLYFQGLGVNKDLNTSLSWFLKSAKHNNIASQVNLAGLYLYNRELKDAEKGFYWAYRAARSDDRDASYILATLYEDGVGVIVDEGEALVWYEKASELGSAQAQLALAKAYYQGRGVQKSKKLAITYLKMSAKQGEPEALFLLANVYATGDGEKKDQEIALALFEAAGNLGYVEAQLVSADMYREGRGTPIDEKKARMWYEKAAVVGNTTAQYNLAVMYENGLGVEASKEDAQKWLKKASEGGNIEAKYLLARQLLGHDRQKNLKAAQLFHEAAKANHSKAQLLLATMYCKGDGVAKNPGMCKRWAIEAQKNGEDITLLENSYNKILTTPVK